MTEDLASKAKELWQQEKAHAQHEEEQALRDEQAQLAEQARLEERAAQADEDTARPATTVDDSRLTGTSTDLRGTATT